MVDNITKLRFRLLLAGVTTLGSGFRLSAMADLERGTISGDAKFRFWAETVSNREVGVTADLGIVGAVGDPLPFSTSMK